MSLLINYYKQDIKAIIKTLLMNTQFILMGQNYMLLRNHKILQVTLTS